MYKLKDVETIKGEDINNLNKQELRELAKAATRFSKQRLSTLGRLDTPARRKLIKNYGTDKLPSEKTIDSMNVNELRHLLKNEQVFLHGKTSKKSGEEKRIRNFIELGIETEGKSRKAIENNITRTISKIGKSNLYKIFELINNIDENNPSFRETYGLGSGEMIGLVIDNLTDEEFKNLIDDPQAFIEKLEEQLKQQKAQKQSYLFKRK